MKCSRCPEVAFLRVDRDTVLCTDCWLALEELHSVASESSPEVRAPADLPPAPDAAGAANRNKTTFRVAASSAIQVSSDV